MFGKKPNNNIVSFFRQSTRQNPHPSYSFAPLRQNKIPKPSSRHFKNSPSVYLFIDPELKLRKIQTNPIMRLWKHRSNLTLYISKPQSDQTNQTICWQQPTNCLNVSDHFMDLVLKG